MSGISKENIPMEAAARTELKNLLDRIPNNYGKYIGCGEGWHSLLIDLDKELAKLSPDYTIAQIKEKFGELCFYILSYGTDVRSVCEEMDQLIDNACRIAEMTCESCGAIGNDVELRNGGWVRTLCGECRRNCV
jgi:hypothetical protein